MPKIQLPLIVKVIVGGCLGFSILGGIAQRAGQPAGQPQSLAPAIATGSDIGATAPPTQKPATPTALATLARPSDTPVPPTATRAATNTPRPTLAATRPPVTLAPTGTKAPATAVPIPTATAAPAIPSGGNYGGSVNGYAPLDAFTCPDYAPIKGNKNSMIYHRPGQSAYTKTKPEVCFARGEDAEASGFRAAKR